MTVKARYEEDESEILAGGAWIGRLVLHSVRDVMAKVRLRAKAFNVLNVPPLADLVEDIGANAVAMQHCARGVVDAVVITVVATFTTAFPALCLDGLEVESVTLAIESYETRLHVIPLSARHTIGASHDPAKERAAKRRLWLLVNAGNEVHGRERMFARCAAPQRLKVEPVTEEGTVAQRAKVCQAQLGTIIQSSASMSVWLASHPMSISPVAVFIVILGRTLAVPPFSRAYCAL